MTTPIGPGPSERRLLRWSFRIAGLTVLILGLWFVHEIRRSLPPEPPEVGSAATVLPVPKPLPEFSLVDQSGAPFRRDRFEGHWSFVFFGYTHCPSICPITLGTMRDLRGLLQADEPATEAEFVFVSIDPERDGPETLAAYLRHFDPAFTGASGEAEELATLTDALGVFHERSPGGTQETYDFDHTSSLLLVDPNAELYAVFSPPVEPEAAAEAFRAIRSLETGS